MKIIETGLDGLLVLEPKVFRDERGFFLETYSDKAFAEVGLKFDFVQDNHACSLDPCVLRGLHFQLPPSTQSKLVWVVRGSVADVVVDVRKGSPTYGEHHVEILSADNFRRLLVPKGFAHGYITLEPDTHFMYKVDAPYDPSTDSGILWNDPDLGIDWEKFLKGRTPVVSPKDTKQQAFADFDSPFIYGQE